jgi:hypothetical protein
MLASKTELKPEPEQRQSPEQVLGVARLCQLFAAHEPERQRWR